MMMLTWRVVRVLHGFFVHAYEHVEMTSHKGELHGKVLKLYATMKKHHQEHKALLRELKGLAEGNELGAIKEKLAAAFKHEEEEEQQEMEEEERAEQHGHGHGGGGGAAAHGHEGVHHRPRKGLPSAGGEN